MEIKSKIIWVLAASFLAGAPAYALSAPREIRAVEWLELSLVKRMEHILASMVLLSQNGVPLGKTPDEYYDAVAEKLRFTPDLFSVNVTQILAGIVYETEPGTREVLDGLRKKRG